MGCGETNMKRCAFTLRLLWLIFGATDASVLHTCWLCVRKLRTRTFSSESDEQRNESNASVTKTFFARGSQNQRSAMPSVITAAFRRMTRKRVLGQ
jgi:hypothetical protein